MMLLIDPSDNECRTQSPQRETLLGRGFSQIFKGTFVSSLSPQVRGFLNRQLNGQVIKKQVSLVHKGAKAGGALKDE
jgi:hypothetical protein